MVNKNRTKKLIKEEPSLTIYPFSIDELKEPQPSPKAIEKINTEATQIQTNNSLEKNIQTRKLNEALAETQQETERIVKQISLNSIPTHCVFFFSFIFELFSFSGLIFSSLWLKQFFFGLCILTFISCLKFEKICKMNVKCIHQESRGMCVQNVQYLKAIF